MTRRSTSGSEPSLRWLCCSALALTLFLRPAHAHAEPGVEVFVLFFGTPVALVVALLGGAASFFVGRRGHSSTLFKVLSTAFALVSAFAVGELLWAVCMFGAESLRPGYASELFPPGAGYSACTMAALLGWIVLTVVRLRRKQPV